MLLQRLAQEDHSGKATGLEEAVRKVLKEQVDPVLSQHFGGSELTRIQDGVAYVRLTGACASCPSAQETIQDVVKDFVMGGVDGINGFFGEISREIRGALDIVFMGIYDGIPAADVYHGGAHAHGKRNDRSKTCEYQRERQKNG